MNNRAKLKNITIEDAVLRFRNFSGKPGKFNPPGRRNFSVLLDDKIAKALKEEGWNVRWLDPIDEGADPQPYLSVEVRYDIPENVNIQPPKAILISHRGKSLLEESELQILDWAEIETVDITIRPRFWKMPNGSSGVKAYLQSIYVTIVEDDLDKKYYDVKETSAIESVGGCGNCETCDGHCQDH